MKVLSLFDGISCGQYVLKSLDKKVEAYYASEIDTNAIQCTMHHFPKTMQLGDVTKINTAKLPKIDLLIGGSPCQGFSFSGKGLAFDDPRSKLFFEYVRIYRELRVRNPKLKFMLENVRMKKKHSDVITKYLETDFIYIDSAHFSAQSRKRVYWTNIPQSPFPEKSRLALHDILGPPYFTGDTQSNNKGRKGHWNQHRGVTSIYAKTRCILTQGPVAINVPLSPTASRKATSIELERLAGLPDNYTEPCGGATKRLHAIGNGWECNTIKHIFKNL